MSLTPPPNIGLSRTIVSFLLTTVRFSLTVVLFWSTMASVHAASRLEIGWWLNPAHRPSNLSMSAAWRAMSAAGAQWSAVCPVDFVFRGFTTRQPEPVWLGGDPHYVNVVGWGSLAGTSFANLLGTTRTIWFADESTPLPFEESADIAEINVVLVPSMEDASLLQAVMVHEWGHAIGLPHRAPPSVMSNAPYPTQKYLLAGPQAADAAACLISVSRWARVNGNMAYGRE